MAAGMGVLVELYQVALGLHQLEQAVVFCLGAIAPVDACGLGEAGDFVDEFGNGLRGRGRAVSAGQGCGHSVLDASLDPIHYRRRRVPGGFGNFVHNMLFKLKFRASGAIRPPLDWPYDG